MNWIKGPNTPDPTRCCGGVLLGVDLYNSMVSYIRSFDDVELIRRRLLEMDVDERTYLSLEQLDQAMKQRSGRCQMSNGRLIYTDQSFKCLLPCRRGWRMVSGTQLQVCPATSQPKIIVPSKDWRIPMK
ncbi:MAG: hypothetical protein R2867_04250 [Caldilineaceae bacterium]